MSQDYVIFNLKITDRWHQISEWLKYELNQKTLQHSSSIYVVEQFIEFLQERGITVERVSEELIPGLKSLHNLMAMLYEALAMMKASSIKENAFEDGVGYSFKVKNNWYWVGIMYERPNVLKFDKEFGSKKNYQTLNELDLSSSGTQFFKLSPPKQLQSIEKLFSESLEVL